VETGFLPDREREAQEIEERERLKSEWIREQERIESMCAAQLMSREATGSG